MTPDFGLLYFISIFHSLAAAQIVFFSNLIKLETGLFSLIATFTLPAIMT